MVNIISVIVDVDTLGVPESFRVWVSHAIDVQVDCVVLESSNCKWELFLVVNGLGILEWNNLSLSNMSVGILGLGSEVEGLTLGVEAFLSGVQNVTPCA